MESFFVRYRNLLVLLALLLAQIIGLAVQVRRANNGRNVLDPPDGAGVRLIRLWADGLLTPPEQMVHGSKLGVLSLWQNYLDLRHTREQNLDLQKTIDRMRLEQASLLEDARQGQRLQALNDFQQKYIQDPGRTGHRLQRKRSVPRLLHRQGSELRFDAGYGCHHR